MTSVLRRTVDAVGAVTGTAAVLVVILVGVQHYRTKHKIESVTTSLREFDRVLSMQTLSGEAQLTRSGWPATIRPEWFEASVPMNTLMPAHAPWLEIAGEEQAHLLDPPARVSPDSMHAGFWYNPFQGVVRARVPLIVSEQRSIELYNQVNHRFITVGYEPNLTTLNSNAVPAVDGAQPSSTQAIVEEQASSANDSPP